MSDKKQEEMLQEIRDYNRKKDYYEVLGVSRTAQESQIKKAYRRLALRFHPDKNQYPGAKEVFKKVSNAYAHLIDDEKRAHYDRFGPEEEQRAPPQHHYHRRGGHEDYQFDQFDHLFRAFFGQMPPQARQRPFRQQQYQQANANAHPHNQTGINFYFLFFLFFLLYSVLMPLFESRPNYSLQPSQQHRYRKKTSTFGVEFYVNKQYLQDAKEQSYKRTSEMTIDKEYLNQMERVCDHNKRQKRQLQQYAYRYGAGTRRDSYLRQAQSVDTTTCNALNDLRGHFPSYVRELGRMR